jgi:hypothetical protein
MLLTRWKNTVGLITNIPTEEILSHRKSSLFHLTACVFPLRRTSGLRKAILLCHILQWTAEKESFPSNKAMCPHSCPYASPRSSVDPLPRDPSGTVVVWLGSSWRMFMLWHQLNVTVVILWPVASLFLRRSLVNQKAQGDLWP